MSFGIASGGWYVGEFYRPTIQEFSDTVMADRHAKLTPDARVPIPDGWNFDLARSSLLVGPIFGHYARFKKAYGFVANLHECPSGDTASPFQATVVLKLPSKYGDKASEFKSSWAFARIDAFAAKAKFLRNESFLARFPTGLYARFLHTHLFVAKL